MQLLGEPCRNSDVAQLGRRFGRGGSGCAFPGGGAGDPGLPALDGFSAAHGAHHLGADLCGDAVRRGAAARHARRAGRCGRGDDRPVPPLRRTGGTIRHQTDRRIVDRVDVRPWKVGGTGVQSYLETQPEELPVRLEAGTLNGHGIAGLSAAIDYIEEIGIDVIHEKEQMLMKRFYDGIKDLPGVTVYGDQEKEKTAIIAFNVGEEGSGKISDILSYEYGISTRPGAHCAPRMHQALGTVSQGAVRFSFSCFNTAQEVDEAVKAMEEICSKG